MSIESIVLSVNKKLEDNIYFSVANTHAKMSERIFEQLKDKNGASPKPYASSSYSKLKAKLGRPHLELTGALGFDFNNGLVEVDKNKYQVIVSDENAAKIERHFPLFFGINENELEYLKENLINGTA